VRERVPVRRRPADVDLALPRWKARSKIELSKPLQALGMKRAFTPSAEFEGITRSDNLAIDAVLHEAMIDVNEKGTVAAAATAVIIAIPGAGQLPETFHANHPFLYFLRDRHTGLILFVGKVTDPSYGST
jgi:serpin B